MTRDELDKILENHKHWLHKDCDGWEYMKADLRGAELQCSDLANAQLSYADLSYAGLIGVNLNHANLQGANLYAADLENAHLENADLSNADLCKANLIKCDASKVVLRCANLQRATLFKANLQNANLHSANLTKAILCYANMRNACVSDICICDANLYGAEHVPYIPLQCPEHGSFIGFKKAGGYIIKLEIPADAKRLSATTEKCRCDKAKVLEIQEMDEKLANVTEIPSNYDLHFIYRVGEVAEVKDFCEDRWDECAAGIHFFMDRECAVQYYLG